MGRFEEMVADLERREQEAAREMRDEFFASRTDIPDLEFVTPDCSICGLPTDFDDGYFTCVPCNVTWPRNGYGHQAERHADA